jgi:hypothetical protein
MKPPALWTCHCTMVLVHVSGARIEEGLQSECGIPIRRRHQGQDVSQDLVHTGSRRGWERASCRRVGRASIATVRLSTGESAC